MNECKPQREKLIPLELNQLSKALDELHESLDGLVEKLSPILRKSPPPCDKIVEADASTADCPLANDIVGRRRQVERLVASVRDVKERLEI